MIYICDKIYNIDIILDMYDNDIMYGIILICGKEYLFYNVYCSDLNKDIKLLFRHEIHQYTKHNKGGYSSARFERIWNNNHHNYVSQISENIVNYYTNNTKCTVNGFLIGGPANMKNEVVQSPLYQQYFKQIPLLVVDTINIYNESLMYLINNKLCILNNNLNITQQKYIETEINELLELSSDLLLFGINECIDAYNNKVLKKIYISQQLYNKLSNTFIYHHTEIIITNLKMLKLYGDIIGIKFFV